MAGHSVPSGGPLAPYRVIDLTTIDGWLCGKLLADLGADVVKVEPPGGDPGRGQGPFVAGREGDPEADLGWWFANRGKQSVVLDHDEPGDRSRLAELVAAADAVVESYGPGGFAAAWGVDVDGLLAANPQLVVTSLSPYGGDGPYRDRPGPDLAVTALSGQLWLNGDTDRPPVRITVPQSARVACLEGAAHTAVALYHAARTGQGQHVDVAALPAMVRTLMNATEFKALHGTELTRAGSRVAYSPFRARMVYGCADGHVTFMPALGPLGGPGLVWLVATADEDGADVPAILREVDLCDASTWIALSEAGRTQELIDAIEDTVEKVFAPRSKEELYRTAIERLLLLAPVNTVADLRHDHQLAAREYWDDVEMPDGTRVTFPGPWARFSATPIRPTAPAPRVGEHTSSRLAVSFPRAASAPPRDAVVLATDALATGALAPDPSSGPFAGLKVWDMSWVGVGPLTARYLGDDGATVVRLDNTVRADVLRVNPPFLGGVPGINRSQFYADYNASKLGIGLDLAHPRGRDVARRLVEWCDVVLESFTPKTLHAFGLDYEELRRINPSLVMLSTCMQGQTGPNRNYRGFGQLMGSLCGFYEITGWPDRDPVMVYGAYTDFLCQRLCTTALVAAIDHRRRTGEGQHIDVSQLEAALQVLGPELLDFTVNGRVATRDGNRDARRAPHSVYPCRPEGEGLAGERWVAVVCEDDRQWYELVERLGRPEWATGPALATLVGRKAAEGEIDRRLAAWTAERDVADVVRLLQGAVAVAPVNPPGALHDDPQLQHLGYFEVAEHTVMGPQRYNGLQARLSRTPGRVRKAAPCLGEDTLMILRDLLGCDDDEIGELLASDAVEINLEE